MKSFNQITVIGNIGATPELKKVSDDLTVLSFSVAVNRASAKRETTDWFRVAIFGVFAETMHRYLEKGSRVFVQGELRFNTYTNDDGHTANSHSIIAQSIVMLDAPTNKSAPPADDIPV